jgi:hypothetical protein
MSPVGRDGVVLPMRHRPTRSEHAAPACPSCDAPNATWLSFVNDSGAFQCLKCRCVWMVPRVPGALSDVGIQAGPVAPPLGFAPIGSI